MMPRPTLLFHRLVGVRSFGLFLFGVVIFSLVGVAPVRAQFPGVLSGVVLAPDGSPQAHARVYLQPGNGRPPRTVLTDETGHFTFGKTVSGIYEMRAQANGLWSELIHNVSVKKNDEVKVKLQIKAAAPKPAEKP
jgi:L-2-hydroxyglutarate oxidase LhgO